MGAAPNSQERGVYEVDFLGWGEAGPGEGAGAGKRQLPSHPGRRRATSPGPRESAPKIDPLLPPEEKSASNLDPSPCQTTKTTSQCYPGGCRFNPNTTAAHQRHGFPIAADEHPVE